MNGTTHMIIGGLTGGLVLAHSVSNGWQFSFNFADYEIYPLIVTCAATIGGLAPDVDMAGSKAGRFLRRLIRSCLIISAIFLVAMYFLTPTGIEIFDGAIGMGARIDHGVTLILAAFCIFVLIVAETSKHRGFTHTLVGLAVAASPLAFMLITGTMFVGADIAVSAQIGFLLGWLSHMVIDSFNYPGTPWLWPLVKKHYKVMRIGSGTEGEITFLMVSIVLFAACYAVIMI